MLKNMSRRFSQKLLLVLFVWGCMVVNVQAERWYKAYTFFPTLMSSQWYNYDDWYNGEASNAYRELCVQIADYHGFAPPRRSGTQCIIRNGYSSWTYNLRWAYTNNNPYPPPPPPPPEQEKKYTIKLSPVTAEPYGNYLTAIEPDGITRSEVPQNLINQVNLVAEVKDQDGNHVNAAIKLKVTAIDNSGGHDQESHTERNPSKAGKLKFGSLNSHTIDLPKSDMIDGIVEFVYAASAVSGDHKIEASCSGITCKQIGKDSVWVGIQDLQELPFNSNYTLIGSSCHHEMNNHYATKRVIEKVQGIARLYRSQFPDDPILRFNDISLERGGLFDAKNEDDCIPLVKANWTVTHNLHRTGEDVDVRANKTATAIPEKNYKAFKKITKRNGCYAEPHKTGSARHFHLYCTQKQGR